MNLAAAKVNSMGIGATRTQKAKVLQATIDGFTDHGRPTPTGLHVVVVPSFTPIKSKFCSGINQISEPDSVPAWMGKNRQPSGVMNRLTNTLSSEGFPHSCISTVVYSE